MINNEKGTTLIEALGAMVILSIVVAAFLSVSSYVQSANRGNDRAAEALRIAEEQLNIAKASVMANRPYTPSLAVEGFHVTIQETEWTAPGAYADLPPAGDRSVTVQSVIRRSSDGRTKLLTCTVSWR